MSYSGTYGDAYGLAGASAGLELLVDDEAIQATLAADATLQNLMSAAGSSIDEIYGDTVPDEVNYPFVRFEHQTNGDTLTHDAVIVINRAQYIVKVTDRAMSYSTIKPIYSRIHALLHKREFVSVADGQVLVCYRLQAVHYPEVTETTHYRHLGGVYRFLTQAA
jgi:hypothetical protein